MNQEPKIIEKAEFNPRIKTYLMLTVGLIMLMTIIGIPILILWILGLGQYYSRRYYEHLECKLTSRHLEFKKGVFFKVEKTIPLENIQDLTFIQNPILNFFELRILKIETAGQSNPKGTDMNLIGIIEMAEFKKKVLHQRELVRTSSKETEGTNGNKEEQIVGLLSDIKSILSEIRDK
jgi:putative membrane protein